MIIPGFRSCRALVSAVFATGFALTVFAMPAKQVWTLPLGADAKWHELTHLGTLLVGTDDALQSVDPASGKLLWRRTDIAKSTRHNAREVAGTPLLVCSTFAGIGNSKVTFQAIDVLDGKTAWTVPQIMGQYLGTIPVPAKHLVIFVVNTYDGTDNGVYLFAHDLTDGARKWGVKLAKANAIPLHLADNSGMFIPTMDLSGYHDPVFDGDEMYLGYLGVQCVDLASGALKWTVEFPAGAKTLTLPDDDKIRVMAVSVAREAPGVRAAQPLYDTLER